MKEKILELRKEGKTYKEIADILGCAKSAVAYHCGENQKEKSRERSQKSRKNLIIKNKVYNFQNNRKLKDKTEDFQRERIKSGVLGKRSMSFNRKDVIEKFGWETQCYLTGKTINLKEPLSYNFDHIIPVSKGGDSTIDNLGIACKEANMAKSDMLLEDFFNLCKEVLEYNGYKVEKI